MAAQRAFEKWSQTDIEKRKELLKKYKEHLAAHVDEMTELLKAETGKPVRMTSQIPQARTTD